MLKEIICDKLPNRQIVFHEGLNVIEGDENAANSIGKSSALLLIDFAFGGQTYSQRDDILAHVGAHDVMMHFVFDGVNYYFKRSTSNPSTIFQCDSSYNKIERTYIIDEYRKLLLSLYHLPGTYLSFRDIVGQFSRIYQRNNCDEKDPLNPGHTTKQEKRVSYLIKLMNKFQKISEQFAIKEDAVKSLSAYNKAVSVKVIDIFSNKKEYKENEKEIEKLNKEVDSIKKQIAYQTMTLSSEQLSRISILKGKLARVQNEKSLTASLIENLRQNLKDAESDFTVDVVKIKELFPGVELKKIEDVNQFHSQLTRILYEEIMQRIEKEQKKWDWYNQQETEYIDRITKVAAETKPENLAIDRLVATKQTVDMLINGKETYETRQQLRKDKKAAENLYNEMVRKVLTDIEFALNKEMEHLNKIILNDDKKAPRISLASNRYSIFCEDDTGTGTSFRALVIFDLAILSLTALPFLIHDSLLFKNVEDDAISGLMSVYENEEKQVFISIDKVPSYHQDVQDVVGRKRVLKLSYDQPLYGYSWNR